MEVDMPAPGRALARAVRRLMLPAAVLASALLGTACTTPQQRAERAQAEMTQLIAIFGPACTQLGYAANSDPWRECVLHLSTRDELHRLGNNSGAYGAWGPGYWRGGGYWGPY